MSRKRTRIQMFADVPEEIRGLSHYAIKQLGNGAWFISIRRLGKPIESRTAQTNDDLAAIREELTAAGLPGVFVDVDRSGTEVDPEDRIFQPPPNPLSTRRGRSNPYKADVLSLIVRRRS